MKFKILNCCLIITSLFGYLEWGKDQHMFLFQMEFDVFKKLFTDPVSVIHPLIILPLVGQILLLLTLFQIQPSKLLTLIGLCCLSLLLFFILFIGFLKMDYKMIFCALPFFIIAVISFRELWINKLSAKNR